MWIADIKGNRLLRLVDGEIAEEIPRDTCVFACALGGDSGHTLFMCATPDFDVEARKANRDSCIDAITVAVPASQSSRLSYWGLNQRVTRRSSVTAPPTTPFHKDRRPVINTTVELNGESREVIGDSTFEP